jgi:hypothetical protein
MSTALGSAVWTTHPVLSDVSGECRHIQVCSDYGNLRIMVMPVHLNSAALAVQTLHGELTRRKARADYAAKH